MLFRSREFGRNTVAPAMGQAGEIAPGETFLIVHEQADEAGAQHTEFRAEYSLDCAKPDAIDLIEFVYFERFPNALELDVQVVTDAGAQGFEVERDDPVLDMRELF